MSSINHKTIYSLNNLDKFETQKFSWGNVSWIHEPLHSPQDRLSMAIVKIFPKQKQEKHFHLGEEQLWHIVQGQGTHIIDGNAIEFKQWDILYCPPYINHEVFNSGDEDLIITIVYVPIKLAKLDQRQITVINNNLKDIVDIKIIKNIEQQLTDMLKLSINVYDNNYNKIIEKADNDLFCKLCNSIKNCTKNIDTKDNYKYISKHAYICQYGLSKVEIPITVNDETLGYIICEGFIIHDIEDIDDKLLKLSKELDMDPKEIENLYHGNSFILKNRIYTIEETLITAAQFIEEVIERNLFENEILTKENEILKNTKERIQLKDALQKAHNLLINKKIFVTTEDTLEIEYDYPFSMEKQLQYAIKSFNRESLDNIINRNKINFISSKNIVKEMITVLIRTTLTDFANDKVIVELRKKYYEKLSLGKTNDDNWKILHEFCLESIDQLKSLLQKDSKNLIANVNKYLEANFKEDISLNHIANVFFVSPNYLSSLFNEKNNMSLSDYIQILRIEKAKDYLINTNLKIKDIGKRVGYNNSSYFINVFKKLVAMTPNEYRISNLEDK